MTVNTAAAMASGRKPPWTIFARLAEKNATSTGPMTTAASTIAHTGQRQRRRATVRNSTLVMRNVPLTAIP
jgi:hypothetical protein